MSNHDPERLLRAQLKDTTPEFEQRWTQLKRELRNSPEKTSSANKWNWAWWTLPSLVSTGLLTLILFAHLDKRPSLPPEKVADYVQLLELEDSLREALPLADPNLTDTFLLMPLPKDENS